MFVCISIRCPEWSKGTNHLANDHWVQVLWTKLLFLKQSQAWNLKAGSLGFRFAYVSVLPFGSRGIINSLRKDYEVSKASSSYPAVEVETVQTLSPKGGSFYFHIFLCF